MIVGPADRRLSGLTYCSPVCAYVMLEIFLYAVFFISIPLIIQLCFLISPHRSYIHLCPSPRIFLLRLPPSRPTEAPFNNKYLGRRTSFPDPQSMDGFLVFIRSHTLAFLRFFPFRKHLSSCPCCRRISRFLAVTNILSRVSA